MNSLNHSYLDQSGHDMLRVVVTADGRMREDMRRLIGSDNRYRAIRIDQLEKISDFSSVAVIIDLDIGNIETLDRLKNWKSSTAGLSIVIIFTIIMEQRDILLDSGLITDANAVSRPLNSSNFTDLIDRLLLPQIGRANENEVKSNGLYSTFPDHAAVLISADKTLGSIFTLTRRLNSISQKTIEKQSVILIESLAKNGIARWTEAVRSHHNLTYQHCLLVTGSAIAFGQHLGFSDEDLARLATGAMLHDLGKADIPVTILDKPSALTPKEMQIVQRHPNSGYEALKGNADFSQDMLDVVLHHHEYLDGSGYPDNLMAQSIPDITRLVTIADVFAALVEKRAYKVAMSGEKAINIMQKMTGKLDMPVLKAVSVVAKAIPEAG
jgi:HD-GYP domain-containing protein (c-di-GMP phosphodiesterase class II)